MCAVLSTVPPKISIFLGIFYLFGTLSRREAYTFGVVLSGGTRVYTRNRPGSSTDIVIATIGLH